MLPKDDVRFTSIPTVKVPFPSPPVDLPLVFIRSRKSFARLVDSLKTRLFLQELSPNFTPFWFRPLSPNCISESTESSKRQAGIWASESALLCSASLALTHEDGTKSYVGKSPLLCFASLSLNESTQPASEGKEVQSYKGQPGSRFDEERVLISEVLVRNKDGEELERKDLEMEALSALKASRANSALTVREVEEDVHRIIDSGYFSSCMPVAVDTRDGIRLMFQV